VPDCFFGFSGVFVDHAGDPEKPLSCLINQRGDSISRNVNRPFRRYCKTGQVFNRDLHPFRIPVRAALSPPRVPCSVER